MPATTKLLVKIKVIPAQRVMRVKQAIWVFAHVSYHFVVLYHYYERVTEEFL